MQSCWFAYYTSGNFNILIAIAFLDLKVPISLQPDCIQLCVTIRCLKLTQSITKYRGDRKRKRVRSLIHVHVTSLPEKEGILYQRVGGGGLQYMYLSQSVNSKTSNLPPVIPEVFDWSFALCSLWKQSFFLATCRCMETFREEELLWLSDNKFHNDDQCKIGLESGQKHWLLDREVTSFKLLLTNDRQETKWHKECKRHEYITKQSIFVEYNIFLLLLLLFSRRSIWVLLELVCRWTQQF